MPAALRRVRRPPRRSARSRESVPGRTASGKGWRTADGEDGGSRAGKPRGAFARTGRTPEWGQGGRRKRIQDVGYEPGNGRNARPAEQTRTAAILSVSAWGCNSQCFRRLRGSVNAEQPRPKYCSGRGVKSRSNQCRKKGWRVTVGWVPRPGFVSGKAQCRNHSLRRSQGAVEPALKGTERSFSPRESRRAQGSRGRTLSTRKRNWYGRRRSSIRNTRSTPKSFPAYCGAVRSSGKRGRCGCSSEPAGSSR